MNWDPFQREVLEALGHALYRVDDGEAASPAQAVRVAEPAVPSPGASPLLHALLRAAGRDAGDTDARALCEAWIAAAPARGPRERRAFWPRLRALRGRPAR